VGVPGRACAGLEGDAARGDPRRGLWRDDRVLPDRASKAVGWRAARRTRAGEMNFHVILLKLMSLLAAYFFEAA
jgi:hypothetical protein